MNTKQVIVDTSVWIDFFQGTLNSKHREILSLLLEAEEVAITDIIRHELLIGTNTSFEYDELNKSLSILRELSVESTKKDKLSRFGFDLRKKGLLGKYTDTTIAFLSNEYGFPILSFDKYFTKLAQKGIISIFSC